MGSIHKEKNSSWKIQCFLLMVYSEKRGKNENDRVASPSSLSIYSEPSL